MKGSNRGLIKKVLTGSRRFTMVGIVLVTIAVVLAFSACTKREPTPTPPLAIGMEIGKRYHEIHTIKLQLKCEFCHTKMTETYYDPLAQVSNLADRRACLSCHKEGSAQPFYGEAWGQATVK